MCWNYKIRPTKVMYNDFVREHQDFDVAFSVGEACQPAFHLSRLHLRTEAFPLDWQMGYNLDTVLHLLSTNFIDFFVDVSENDMKSLDIEKRYVLDNKNGIVSMHHFPKDISLKEGQKKFKFIMNNRAKKLNEKLLSANRVLIVCNRKDNINDIKEFMDGMHLLYGDVNLTLINIRHDSNIVTGEMLQEVIYKNGVCIEDYTIDNTNEHGGGEWWKGNIKAWDAVLGNISIFSKQNYQRIFLPAFDDDLGNTTT